MNTLERMDGYIDPDDPENDKGPWIGYLKMALFIIITILIIKTLIEKL